MTKRSVAETATHSNNSDPPKDDQGTPRDPTRSPPVIPQGTSGNPHRLPRPPQEPQGPQAPPMPMDLQRHPRNLRYLPDLLGDLPAIPQGSSATYFHSTGNPYTHRTARFRPGEIRGAIAYNIRAKDIIFEEKACFQQTQFES